MPKTQKFGKERERNGIIKRLHKAHKHFTTSNALSHLRSRIEGTNFDSFIFRCGDLMLKVTYIRCAGTSQQWKNAEAFQQKQKENVGRWWATIPLWNAERAYVQKKIVLYDKLQALSWQ